jgi:hypothetical protein
MVIDVQEYNAHKIKCTESFASLSAKQTEMSGKLDRLELAMYGNNDLDILGVLQMTKEMHAAFMGSGFTFRTMLKVLSFIALVGGAITFLYKLLNLKL